MRIKGLYIEDEKDNIESYGRYFEDENIEILGGELLASPDDYYDLICDEDIDFVIIDNHLDKKGVSYSGFDVLEKIREQDPYIYLLLLTNYDFQDKSSEVLGEFDQTVMKKDFVKNFEEIISRIKRAHGKRKADITTDSVESGLEKKVEEMDREISVLEKIEDRLEQLIKKDKDGY